MLFLRHEPRAKKMMNRMERRHGKGKALSILAHRLGRAVYHLLKREKTFDAEMFFAT